MKPPTVATAPLVLEYIGSEVHRKGVLIFLHVIRQEWQQKSRGLLSMKVQQYKQ